MESKKLFLKYLGRYCIIFAIVLVSSLLLVARAYQITERNVMEENTWKLRNGVDNLENHFVRMSSMAETLRQVSSLNYLKGVEGSLENQEFVYLNYLEEQLNNISILYDFASMEFMLFSSNDCFISNIQVSDSFANYYGDFFRYENKSAAEFKELVFGQGQKMTLLPCKELKYNYYGMLKEVKNPMLCVIRPSLGGQSSLVDESVAIVFVLEQDKILDLIFGKDAGDGTSIRLFDTDGNTVFGWGTAWEETEGQAAGKNGKSADIAGLENKGWSTVAYEGQEGVLSASAGFSKESVQRYILELVGMLILYVFIGLGAAVVLAFVLAGREYHSMHGLITDVMAQNEKEVPAVKNEYDLLSQSFTQMARARNEYKAKVSLLENQMKNSVLENAMLQGIYTEASQQRFRQMFPMKIEYFCVALLKINTECTELCPEVSLSARDRLSGLLGESRPFMSVLSGGDQEIFLMPMKPEDDSNVTKIQEKFEQLMEMLSGEYGITFSAGISAIGKGLENLHVCYLQAAQVLQAFEKEYVNAAGNYYLLQTDSRLPALVDLEFMQKLANLVLCAEEEAVKQLFEHFLKNYRRNSVLYEMHREEAFYAIRNVLAGLLHQQVLSSGSRELPSYRADRGFEELVLSLEDTAAAMCRAVRDNKKSKNDGLKQDILKYLEENFSDSSLTALKLSQEAGISEKYLYQFMKEQTGYTYAAYVEKLRLGRAEELLRETDLSNTVIAEQAGFGSANTFYRVFSKNKGVSPGKYRENFKK